MNERAGTKKGQRMANAAWGGVVTEAPAAHVNRGVRGAKMAHICAGVDALRSPNPSAAHRVHVGSDCNFG